MRRIVLVLPLFACGDHPGSVPIVADAALDSGGYQCSPAAPVPGGASCDQLAESSLRGTTPFGALDVALVHVSAGDCLTISQATIAWQGACGETLHAQFSYPVIADGDGRRSVSAGTFERDATLRFSAEGAAPVDDVTTVRIDVSTWQEGEATHVIDLTLSVADDRYALAPVRIAGTFCDWPYLLC